jgi:hypothetical protein
LGFFVDQFAKHEFSFGGGLIGPGFVIPFDSDEGALNGATVNRVPADFQLAGELVQESGAAIIGYGQHALSAPPTHGEQKSKRFAKRKRQKKT